MLSSDAGKLQCRDPGAGAFLSCSGESDPATRGSEKRSSRTMNVGLDVLERECHGQSIGSWRKSAVPEAGRCGISGAGVAGR
jgi:hypothetical protein